MKTIKMKWKQVLVVFTFIAATFCVQAQDGAKPVVAVLSIDSKTVQADDITYMVRLELEKTALFTVMDKYEVREIVTRDALDISDCYSKSCLTRMGKILKVDKMLTGSLELLGPKLVISLRLIDVATGTVEKSNVTEFLNLPELQKMIRISVQKIVGITPDPVVVNQLIDYDVPIQSPKNAFRLNGPRMGFAYTMGDAGKIIQSPVAKGGFGMYPVTFEFGWQQEIQYISAGKFQALIENILLIGGLESGQLIPSYTPLLGFRFGKNAWEFGFGPSFRLISQADGFYDNDGLIGAANAWHVQSDWAKFKPNSPFPLNYTTETRLDSRGTPTISTGLVIAVGRTFRSGYLNIPVNAYIVPRQEGITCGATFGFNIQKKDKEHRKGDKYVKKEAVGVGKK